MKTIISLCALCMMTANWLFGQEQPKNLVGISYGIVPAIGVMYFGSPYSIWPNRDQSNVYQIFYARQVHSAIRIGAYFEYERVRFNSNPNLIIYNILRRNIGVNILGQFPQTPLHLQLGGYLGGGSLNADQWSELAGIDFGFIAGPAYEIGKYGFALHVQTGYANYSSSGNPADVKLFNPKILFKFYYRF